MAIGRGGCLLLALQCLLLLQARLFCGLCLLLEQAFLLKALLLLAALLRLALLQTLLQSLLLDPLTRQCGAVDHRWRHFAGLRNLRRGWLEGRDRCGRRRRR